ncbi:MAG: DUF1289 domain-containing protein [Pseudomonadota bacterium]
MAGESSPKETAPATHASAGETDPAADAARDPERAERMAAVRRARIAASGIESPCVQLCMLHPETGLCVGCARTGNEIASWSRLTPAERRTVMESLPSREAVPRTRRGGASARRRREA